jgi:hypothetical protein
VSSVVKEHLILGMDARDIQKQRDLWLSQNPAINVIKIHALKDEPPTLLMRIGGKRVPRVSILVDYEVSGAHSSARHLSSATVPQEIPHNNHAYGGGDQGPNENLFAGKASFDVKEMP